MKDLFSPAFKKASAYFLTFLMLFYVYGCFRNYYQLRVVTSEHEIPHLKELGEIHKYFIIHRADQVMELTAIEVDYMQLRGILKPIEKPYYYGYFHEDNRYKPEEKSILQEVHFYLQDHPAALEEGPVTIPLSQLYKVTIVDPDTFSTTASYVMGTLGVAFIIVSIIALLTKSSCPYVYINDGSDYLFVGEIFGGAILQNLERDDYLPLPQAQPVDAAYHVRITNELKERQYTNLANLLVVNHPAGSEVLLDNDGYPHLIQAPRPTNRALSANGQELNDVLSSKDRNVFLFNELSTEQNYLHLTFAKPTNAEKGKLLLRAKNSLWLDYLYGDFAEKFGAGYDRWIEKQQKLDREERMQGVIDAEFPLSIYLRTDEGWQLNQRLMTVGPLADRDFVIPIGLAPIEGEKIEIRIESGFMFWEIDYAAMDFSVDKNMEMQRILPQRAPASNGQDYTLELAFTDDDYLPQLLAGEVCELHFPAPPMEDGRQQTAFLHARGYYELIREYEGWPKINELRKFREPGYFSEYSKMRYLQVAGEEAESLVSVNE